MAPKVFNRDYLEEYIDMLWKLQENISMALGWGYECRLNRMCEQVEASVDRPPRGRQEATIVRVHIHHLCPKSRDVPAKPGRPKRHCTVLVRTVTRRTSQYPCPLPRHTPQHRATRKGTTPHPGRVPQPPVNSLTPAPPPRVRIACLNHVGTPHTRRVEHTFPLVNVRVFYE